MMLFDRLRGPVGTAATPGVFWRGLRPVAWDGTCLEVPDSPRNVAHFRRHAARTSRPAGYPQLRLTALVECGTRALIDAVFGSQSYTELPQARCLLAALRPGMLLLADRGYDGFEALRDAAATGADLLWRVQARRLLPVIRPLPDGTHLILVTDRRSADRLAKWQQRGRRTAMPALTAPARDQLPGHCDRRGRHLALQHRTTGHPPAGSPPVSGLGTGRPSTTNDGRSRLPTTG
ncbi:transposase [Streptomyces sp. PSAA01]|uniref:transposase n=1 Tax=Streptomyces sp. PSAA01 TaxID=2912762 RepID=UPI001F004F63|nr:transposase [Streptomyces sp. PSAA01]MCG0284837.1 transposase [Streptomyces sp. PSAA01]